MKKIILSVALIILGTHALLAQESYLRFGVGYGLPSGGTLLNYNDAYNATATTFYTTSSGVYGSYGSGIILHASYGHMFGNHLGMDVNFQYLIGKKYDGSYTSVFSGTTNISEKSSTYGGGFSLSPSMIFRAGEGNVRPYARMGLVIGSYKVTRETETSTQPITKKRTELTGGLSLGFNGGVGIDFGATKKVNFFTEVLFTSIAYYPNEGEVTEYTVNGVDQPLMHQKTIFKDQTSYSSNDPTPLPGSPTQTLSSSAPFGSLTVSAGVKFRLN